MQNSFMAIQLGIAITLSVFHSSWRLEAGEPTLYKELVEFVEKRESEFESIPAERKKLLEPLIDYLRECKSSGKPARLIFVCTHNSRRSHMSQLWGAVAAVRYGVVNVETFSGGTECTAFNPRAIAAMERAGFKIELQKKGENPTYLVSYAENLKAQLCFSKLYTDAANPTEGFCAVMTCANADKSCPSVKGAVKRIAIPYEDPKIADNTPEESSKYDERSSQICREILYAFSRSVQP